jgi:6-phosphofructokinase 1
MISVQGSRAIPMYFEELKNPTTGKTFVRKVNIDSVSYKIARSFMQRLEREDLDNPEIAKLYNMTPEDFKKRYLYMFE